MAGLFQFAMFQKGILKLDNKTDMIEIATLGAQGILKHFEAGAGFSAAAAMFEGVQAGFGFAARSFRARGVSGGFVAAGRLGLPPALFVRPGSSEQI